MNTRKALAVTETAAVWLFFLQAIRTLFSTLFGVLYDLRLEGGIQVLVAGLDLVLLVLVMLTPLLLNRLIRHPPTIRFRVLSALLARLRGTISSDESPDVEGRDERGTETWFQLLAASIFVVRAVMTLDPAVIRLYTALLLLAGANLYIAYLLRKRPRQLMFGLIAGMGADQFLRAFDYTYDPTLRPGWLLPGIFLSLLLIVMTYLRDRVRAEPDRGEPDEELGGVPLSVGLALGAFLFLQTSLLGLPNALTRWTGMAYHLAAPILLLATVIFLSPAVRTAERWLALFLWPLEDFFYVVVCIVPLFVAAWVGGRLSAWLLLVAQFAMIAGLFYAVVNKRTEDLDQEQIGRNLSLGLFLFVLLSLLFAFTFTYAYTLPFMRGLGRHIILFSAFVVLLSFVDVPLDPEYPIPNRDWAITSTVLVVLPVLVCAFLIRPLSLSDSPATHSLPIATYNIHYGYGSDWAYNLDEIAETIEQSGAGLVVLQEVDTGRITSYSVDAALWLGQRLNMRVVYAPTLEKFSGMALLSRYPLSQSDYYWLDSEKEQTALISAQVKTVDEPLYVYGLWLGLEADERLAQVRQALQIVGDDNPAVLAGDFNATPDSSIYDLVISEGFEDPFTQQALTYPATVPQKRVDYIWLRGLSLVSDTATVKPSTASDHRLVFVEATINSPSSEGAGEP